jgi:hypothetical protein
MKLETKKSLIKIVAVFHLFLSLSQLGFILLLIIAEIVFSLFLPEMSKNSVLRFMLSGKLALLWIPYMAGVVLTLIAGIGLLRKKSWGWKIALSLNVFIQFLVLVGILFSLFNVLVKFDNSFVDRYQGAHFVLSLSSMVIQELVLFLLFRFLRDKEVRIELGVDNKTENPIHE